MPPDVTPPFEAADFFAFVMALLALLYAVLWLRDRERGMGWFAVGAVSIAVFAATNRWHLPPDAYVLPSPWYVSVAVGVACLGQGLVDYLAVPPAWRRRATLLVAAPMLVFFGLLCVVWLGWPVRREWANLTVGVSFFGMSVLAWWAAWREPGAGHGWVGTTLFAIPALTVVMALSGMETVTLRYWALPPIAVQALTLLTTSLLRRRRALEQEVTRRAAAEEALRALNATLEAEVARRTADLNEIVVGLESFNRNVSHDLRGPLGGIASAADLALAGLNRGDQARARSLLEAIGLQARLSAGLVEALLHLARVRDAVIEPRPVDVQSAAQAVVEQIRLTTPGRPMPAVQLHAAVDAQADPALLHAILLNLIGNALKFSRDRTDARVEVGAQRQGDEVEVFVRDNGVGFDEAQAQALFKPFQRLHGNSFEGHGVGLSIVRRAVERQGGRVWADAAPGQGATFHFTLPAATPG
ncbi:MAG: hypothetical protein HY855_22290 [Burkholderiales bacterium]|nr:hypothetical protein [Burkholderiales bacterium]